MYSLYSLCLIRRICNGLNMHWIDRCPASVSDLNRHIGLNYLAAAAQLNCCDLQLESTDCSRSLHSPHTLKTGRKTMNTIRTWVICAASASLIACGGGGSSTPASTSSLSSDQQLFESFYLASNGGAASLSWNLPATGMPSTASGNYVYAATTSLPASPATGSQLATGTKASLSMALSLPARNPGLYLSNGEITVFGYANYSYSGTGIVYNGLSSDQKTIGLSNYHSKEVVTPLNGLVSQTPIELKNYLGNLFSNSALLKPDAMWQPGAAYMKSNEQTVTDRIDVVDCLGLTNTGINPSPCATSTTVEKYFASKSLNMVDGTLSTLQGRKAWIATSATPINATYRQTYLELNGNVYFGWYVKSGSSYITKLSDGTLVNWFPTFNQSAVNSLKAAVAF